jgi:hypothetical protein
MITLSIKQINDIAQELDCGMKCYVNTDTGEYKSILDGDDVMDDIELWEEELEEIEKEWTNYVVLEKMPSPIAFKVMARFADTITNEATRDRLFYALDRRSPFRNFRNEVDYDEELREQWFAFKIRKYEEYVCNSLSEYFDFEKQE